jgi:hypothetical protein
MTHQDNSEMNDLEILKKLIHAKQISNFDENPYFAKKVMNQIFKQSQVNNGTTWHSMRVSIYVKIVLFVCLVLFPALTEAI